MSDKVEAETLPQLFLKSCERYGEERIALRRKDHGIWNAYSWKCSYENVKYFSLGLISCGLNSGDKVAIIGENAPEWYWAALAVQAARATVVGIFTDSTPSEVQYIADHSDSVFVIAEDQEQVDKILDIRKAIPKVRNVIYWDPEGMYSYRSRFIMYFYDVVRWGREHERMHHGLFESNVKEGKPDDIGVVCYTSGTTGLQKGAMLSQAYLIETGECWTSRDNWYANDQYVSYLSPAWATEWALGMSSGLRTGVTLSFAEDPETVQENVREIGPQVVFYGSRMWESLNSLVQVKISDTNRLFRLLYDTMLPIGYKVTTARIQGRKDSPLWEGLYWLADWLLFRPLRDKLGFMNIRWGYTAGAGASPDILRFFQAIGVNLKQLYGLTETQIVTTHLDGQVNPETVGPPLPFVQLRISDEGELCVKVKSPFSGYYKDPERTREVLDSEGWFHTGDAAYIDEDGQVVILDRMVSMMELADGHSFPPDFVETRLRFSQYIKDVICIGGKGKPYVTAIVVIDFSNVGKWAENHRLAYTTFADLSQKSEVSDLILEEMEKVNRILPSWSKIKKYVPLHKELDPDEAELTRTRKLRRGFVEDKYRDLIEAMYTDGKEVLLEIPVMYQDGRKGVTKTSVKVRDVSMGKIA